MQLYEITKTDIHHLTTLMYNKTRNWADAEDIVQDALCRAWTKKHQFDGTNLPGWLYCIASKLLINKVRKPRIIDDRETDFEVMLFNEDHSESGFIAKGLIDDLVPVKYKDIARLHYDDRTTAEISAFTGIKEATVLTKTNRLRVYMKMHRSKCYDW